MKPEAMKEVRSKVDELLAFMKENGMDANVQIWLHKSRNAIEKKDAVAAVEAFGGLTRIYEFDDYDSAQHESRNTELHVIIAKEKEAIVEVGTPA